MEKKTETLRKAAGESGFSCAPVTGGMKITCEGKTVILSENDFLAAIKTWLGDSAPEKAGQKKKLQEMIK